MGHFAEPTSAGFTNLALDASTDKVGWVFVMGEAATINTLLFRYGTRTGTPPTYQISLQGVTTAGVPDGTPIQSATFTPPASTAWNSTIQAIAISNASLSAETPYAIVIEYSSGTINGSNNGSFTQCTTVGVNDGLPYSVADTLGSWNKDTSGMPVFGLRSASTTYGRPFLSFTNAAAATSDGNRIALKLTLPAGAGDTFKVSKIRVWLNVAGTASMIGGIWNAAGTAIDTVTIDSDVQRVPASAAQAIEFPINNPTALSFGTPYYFGVERAGADITLRTITVPANGDLAPFPYGTVGYQSIWSGGAWADTDTAAVPIELAITDITEPTGAAPYHGALSGGLLV
jgi:hypothetical protein